jgi:tryptophan 2,3-dioxygenase
MTAIRPDGEVRAARISARMQACTFLLPCGHQVSAANERHHYCNLLRLETLLELPPDVCELCHPDHHMFLVVHQAVELLFNSMLFEMRRLVVALDEGALPAAIALARRLAQMSALLTPTTNVLRTIAPSDFHVLPK